MRDRELTILIPVYNEEDVIEKCVKHIQDKVRGNYEILIVDDGSTDRTTKILRDLIKSSKNIRVINHKSNKGLGAALKRGFRNARGGYIVTIDADLTHDPSKINKLVELAKLENADLVIASRFIVGGGMRNVPLSRVFLSKFFNRFSRVLFSVKVSDLTSGFRVYKNSSINKINILSNDFSVQIEIAIKMARTGYKIIEVPYLLKNRMYGYSKAPGLFNLFKIYSKTILELIR